MATVNTQFKKGQRPSIKTEFKKGSIPANKKEKISVNCKNCKKEFGVQPYRKETALFCSHSCVASFNMTGDKHHQWKGGINYNLKYRQDILGILGFKCVKCGFDDIRALQIDHVNGGGTKERKIKGNGNVYKVMLTKVLEGSKDYQILCANCNWIKKVENKELPNNIKQ